MTNEKMLATISEIANCLDADDRKAFDFIITKQDDFSDIVSIPAMLATLVKQLREDIVKDEAKKAGRSRQLAAAKRILKTAVQTNKESLTYAPIQNNKQCVCDGYRAVRLVNHLAGLPELPENIQYVDLNGIVQRSSDMTEIELPDAAKLSAYIKTYKAEHGKKASKPMFDFGEEYQVVDAEYLLDMLLLIPDAKAYSVKNKGTSVIYFENEAGDDGVLLPIHPKRIEVRQKTIL